MTDIVVDPEPTPPKRSPLPIVLGLLAVVALVVGIVLVASDGDDGGTDDPVTLIGGAPDAAREAGSARMTMTMEMSGGDMPMNLDIDGEGLVDFVTGDSSFDMSMFGMDFTMRYLDETMYMQLPDGRWAAMSLSLAGGATGSMTPNATGFLEALRGISTEIEELGSREINGQDAQGFRATVDVDEAVEQAPPDYRDLVADSLAQAEAAGMTEIPTEIWVTDDGLPVRLVMDLTTDLFDMSMTMDYLDVGIDVDIEKPPAAETITVEDPQQLQELMMSAGAPK